MRACVITGITTLFGCENEETEDIFQCQHYDTTADAAELFWTFTVPNGRYIVNLFFANTRTDTTTAGSRVFDILVEGNLVYNDFDQIVAAGGSGKAVVRAADVTVTDGNGSGSSLARQVGDPAIKAIEVLSFGCTSAAQCNDNNVCTTDTCVASACQYANNTASCNDVLACTSSDVCGGGTCHGTSNCPSGQACNAQSGVCEGSATISFDKSLLVGDDAHQSDVAPVRSRRQALRRAAERHDLRLHDPENAPNNYVITDTQTDQPGQEHPEPQRRRVARARPRPRGSSPALVAAGTAANPVLYVASSDPRIGGGANANDINLDTNSGIISRLTWNGAAWTKLDLVRGLPRSEENHAANGMALDAATNTLYVAHGGHTNMGAPSNNFAFLPEYALSAAILSIDLDAIGEHAPTTCRRSTTRTARARTTRTIRSAATTAGTRRSSCRAGRCRSTRRASATPTTW